MNQNKKRVFAILMAGTMLTASAQAATITPSATRITLDEDQNTFTVDLHLSEDEPFAGAEFGIDLPEGVELTEVEYLDDAIVSASHTPEVERNGRVFFGFYRGENAFEGDYEVARLTFTYSGDADVELTLGDSNVVTLIEDEDGNTTTTGDHSSAPFTVEVTRDDGNGGGTGGGSDHDDDDDDDDNNHGGTGGGSTGGGSTSGGNTSGGNTTGGSTSGGNTTGGETSQGIPFTDVSEDAWYFGAVEYVYHNGLMQGTSATIFNPNGQVTRSTMAQILYNMAGQPAGERSNPFSDVAAGAWYTDAVLWAAETGVVQGNGQGQFLPDDLLTREQLAAMLYRNAGSPAVEAGGLAAFPDGGNVSDWAKTSMEWAVAQGVLSGKSGGSLDPQGVATRAEVAQMLMNLGQSQNG